MLKRLLIAVFVLGMLLSINGIAFADIDKRNGELNPVIKMDLNHPRINDVNDARPVQPAFKKPASALKRVPSDLSVPAPPLDYFCDLQSYDDGVYWGWANPDAYNDDLFNTRFTADDNFDCTVKVGHVLMLNTTYGDGSHSMTGTPVLRIYLWDDDGFGFPGSKLDSVEFTNAELVTETGAQGALFWMSADFSAGNWVFSDGEEYHIGWTMVGGVGDTLSGISDNATGPFVGEERSSEYYAGAWGSMLNDWGVDYAFVIYSERCCGEIPFTDCYSELALNNLQWFWRTPDPTYGDEAFSQRFTLFANDTLVSIDFAIYNDDGSASNFDPSGSNTVYMTIWGDDGAGLPDPGNMIAQQSYAPNTYSFYPTFTTATFNLALPPGDYHSAFSTDGVANVSYESCLSSDGSDGVGGSASDWGGGNWYSMLDGWGVDYNFYFIANICRDQFALCFDQNTIAGLAYFYRLPDIYGDTHDAQKVHVTGINCQVREVGWRLYDNGSPGIYAHDAIVEIYEDVAGLPGGSPLASQILTPADYVLYPGRTYVDFTLDDVYRSTDFWVSITSTSPALDSTQGIRTLTDAGGSGVELEAAELYLGTWEYIFGAWGGRPIDVAFDVRTSLCCVPFTEADCATLPETGWATLGGNQGRTGRSNLSLGDSWCDLNLNWGYEDPISGVAFCGPTIFNDMVLCTFSDKIISFNLITGAINYEVSPGLPVTGTSMRTTATVATITALGKDLAFAGGGAAASFFAFDVANGAIEWSRDIISIGPASLQGDTRWGIATVLDLEGTQYVYWGTDDGIVQAANAATGVLLWGPVPLGISTFRSNATDGTSLFFGTQSSGAEGDIYSIDAATGDINWMLSGEGGLQAAAEYGAQYTGANEGFTGGIAYENGVLYSNSRASGGFPVDGLFYRISSASGNLAGPVTLSNRVIYAAPTVDVNYVYQPTFLGWLPPVAGGHIVAFDKNSGANVFQMGSESQLGRYYMQAILTCEPDGADDQLFAFNQDGFLSAFNAEDGTELWRRRVDNPGSGVIGQGGALAKDSEGVTHLVYADFWGDVYDMTKGGDRPRLQFRQYFLAVPVEFGDADELIVDMGPLLTNTGCTDLNITAVNVDEASFGPGIPSFSVAIDDNAAQRASSIANDLTKGFASKQLTRYVGEFEDSDDFMVRNDETKNRFNPSASAFPAFLNSVDVPFAGQVVAPGEEVNLIVDVIQSVVLRGPQNFYVQIVSDDPDFFLNDPTASPQVAASIIGGCLIDTTTMEFGVGGANIQLVTNTGRLGTGDWSPHGFEIDGDGASYYQGAYLWHISKDRMATHTQDWTSGGGELDAIISLQPDPNYRDSLCKPFLSTVPLGDITTNGGATYTPIMGNLVSATYLDSVQAFGGDFTNFGAPFDNDSTMGLICNQRTIGALDVPGLANLTLGIMEITERNGNSINGWFLSSFHDYDVGGDNANADVANSVAWSYNPGGDGAWGQIKIPFGPCDGPTLINAHGMYGDAALWDMNAYFDSAYIHANAGSGYFDHNMLDGDGEVHITLAQHDFTPNETYTVGVVNFGVTGLTDNTSGAELAPMARLVNKWAGFGRGDVNDDGLINLTDILYLAAHVNSGGNGPIPFMHTGDVNNDSAVDGLDVTALIDFYFYSGACPVGDWVI